MLKSATGGGLTRLLKSKSEYFKKFINEFKAQIDEKSAKNAEFKAEIYDKLYDFFHRYFSPTGSIFYTQTPLFYNIYTKTYEKIGNKDTELFYKTNMLYYVKSDKIYSDFSLNISIDATKLKEICFLTHNLKEKIANQKAELVFSPFRADEFMANLSVDESGSIKLSNDTNEQALKIASNLQNFTSNSEKLFLSVSYSQKGRKTKIDEILKFASSVNFEVSQNTLEGAIKVFSKQSSVDFFINKNAEQFLKSELDLWIYQYMFSQNTEFSEARIKQIADFKEIANELIKFISNFENELLKIWLKFFDIF